MRPIPALRVLWAVGLFAVGAQAVYAERHRVDTRVHDRYSRDVRAVEALDARLNEQVMQSRQSLVTHYDDIVATAAALRDVHASLAQAPSFLPADDAHRVLDAVGASRAALADKMDQVEVFKRENAILRNSARFFPVAAEELRDQLEVGATSHDEAARVNELLCTVLHDVELPSDAERERAHRAYDALTAAPRPDLHAADVDVVLLHAKTLLEKGPTVADLTNAILAAPTRARADQLDATYQASVRAAVSASERRRAAMVVTLMGVIALVAADLVQRFRRAARSEREAASNLAKANAALLREKAREKELSDLKNRFVSMTSHEFRTPLSVILSSTELLEAYGDRWTPTKRSDHFTRVKSAVGTMKGLLDAVLVIGKSDAGKMEFSPAPMNARRFLAETIDALSASLPAEHRLCATVDADLPEAVLDEKLLSHVLTNLVSNAVKYSPEGGDIEVTARRDDTDLSLTISDRGIGISEADLPTLFDSFHRGRNVGNIPGTGLGLAMVKRAVIAHGGTISVTSNEGEGTTFAVRLPAFPQRGALSSAPDATPPSDTASSDGGGLVT